MPFDGPLADKTNGRTLAGGVQTSFSPVASNCTCAIFAASLSLQEQCCSLHVPRVTLMFTRLPPIFSATHHASSNFGARIGNCHGSGFAGRHVLWVELLPVVAGDGAAFVLRRQINISLVRRRCARTGRCGRRAELHSTSIGAASGPHFITLCIASNALLSTGSGGICAASATRGLRH